MNRRQLAKLGVPESCLNEAVRAVQAAAERNRCKAKQLKRDLQAVLDAPVDHVEDDVWGPLAKALTEPVVEPREPIECPIWGEDGIDDGTKQQMEDACRSPHAVAAALMPDAHIGYGLPIGGVLALENAVIPYAVGVDIACRMKMSVLDLPVESLDERNAMYSDALQRGTRFGVGSEHEKRQHHDVMDQDWTVTKITRERKDRAWKQLGTSGSGNHFVEFGLLTLNERDEQLGLDAGQYVALLSHSGSRGAGAAVCSTYSNIARARLPKRMEKFGRLAWLELDSEAGQEYWAAMNLMGDYAAANHAVIHRLVTKLVGAEVISGVENHHNFAWREEHEGKEVIVHRKGATPAGQGDLGVIPGTMADPAFVVRGKGNPRSVNSASHGAGRVMSRKKANQQFRWNAERQRIADRGVKVLSAGADEVPGVYKDIRQVMADQADLVDIVAQFDPRIVKMCGDGSRAED